MSNSQNFNLFAMNCYYVSAFEWKCFEEHGDAIHEFACHFVNSMQSFADFEYAYEFFLDFSAQVLQIVLVRDVQIYSVFDFFFFCDTRFTVSDYFIVYPI